MKKKVELIVDTLSYTELQAVKVILKDIVDEKVVIASELAKEYSRSLTVNGLRIIKAAGVIDTRSLGMKGTYIKVLEQDTLKELLNY